MIFFTSINYNYFSKASLLAQSVKAVYPGSLFIVMLTEREINDEIKPTKDIDQIILTKDIGFGTYEKFIFKFNVVEACTAVKGQAFDYIFNNFEEHNKVVYLDPDICLYSKMDELEKNLESKEIILTPHLSSPENKDTFKATVEAVMDNELAALKHGVYNLGFLALKKGKESTKFVDWWKSRLEMFCYNDIPNGIFTDQKWCDLAPAFFDVSILKHPGYNVAPWNISNRLIKKVAGQYTSNEQPLRFFHFSGFDSGANEAMIMKYSNSKDVIKLRDEYVEKLRKFGKQTKTIPWSYNYYLSGETIDPQIRRMYRENPNIFNNIYDPFFESNNSIRNLSFS